MKISTELAFRIERAKREVLADVTAGIVPATAASFSELHDYLDANGCGGAFEDDAPDTDSDIWNALQDAIDAWIRSGEMARAAAGVPK